MYKFRVRDINRDTDTVEAEGYCEDGAFVNFRDDKGDLVYSIRVERLQSVERLSEPDAA
jgi:hypothetical protein